MTNMNNFKPLHTDMLNYLYSSLSKYCSPRKDNYFNKTRTLTV